MFLSCYILLLIFVSLCNAFLFLVTVYVLKFEFFPFTTLKGSHAAPSRPAKKVSWQDRWSSNTCKPRSGVLSAGEALVVLSVAEASEAGVSQGDPRKQASEQTKSGINNTQKGTPGCLSGWMSAFGSGRDPRVPGWSPTSGSLLGACFYLCLCLCLFCLCVSHQ